MTHRFAAFVLVAFATSGCGSGSDEAESTGIPSETTTASATTSQPTDPAASDTTTDTTARETAEPSPSKKPKPRWNLPKGYPKVVAVSTLPDQVRSWYQMSGTTKAVAIAPGVWAELTPGAAMADAVESGVYDGFCSSKTAFERKWLDGGQTAGTCW